jgi:predicted outer membrane repeat protein
MKLRTWLMGVVTCAGLAISATAQTTWYVDNDACPGPGDGSDASPFCAVQDAIAAAADGDTVVVRPGVYSEALNLLGKAITLRSEAPADPVIVAATVLDGLGQFQLLRFVSGERPDTVVDGFTIRNGSGSLGGALAVASSDPTIRRCVFEDNTATEGGAAYVYVSSMWFDRCVFRNNTATRGGAVYAASTNWVRFDDCVIEKNSATDSGGGIGAEFARVRLQGSVLAENAAPQGGGYRGFLSDPFVVSTLVRDNTAEEGGAFYFYDDNIKLLSSTVVRNVATGPLGGGVASGIDASPIIRNSIVRDNQPNPFVSWISPTVSQSNIEGGFTGPGVIDEDPLFVAPEENDFRLQAGSPSVDTGRDGWVPGYANFDADGLRRISGSATDMGAFEVPAGDPPAAPPVGQLVVAVKDDGVIASGDGLPLALYDIGTQTWSPLVRNAPTLALATDPAAGCFWLHSGETGMLVRIPYDTLELEEIGLLRFAGRISNSVSGMAVRDGVLYATLPYSGGGSPPQVEGLYAIDTGSATMSLVTAFPAEFEVWDLHYEADTDRLLVLSNSPTPGPAGVFELDLATGNLTEVQPFVNPDPFTQANGLQGLATGAGQRYLFRPLYNDLQVYDAQTNAQVETLNVPGVVPGGSWVLAGLAWTDAFSGGVAGDMDGDRDVDLDDVELMMGCFSGPGAVGTCRPDMHAASDMDGDGDVDLADVAAMQAAFTGP